MAKIIPKCLNLQQAHDYVSAQHRVDQVDNKRWAKSVRWFWLGVAGFMLFMALLDYATACGPESFEGERIEIKVRGI